MKTLQNFCAIHQHASHLLFHPDKFSQAALLSLILPTNLPLTDCSGEKRAKQGWTDRSGEDCLALTDLLHSGDTVALCQASRALLILQREVRERLCTGHVSLFSLVSLYIMYKEYSDPRRAPSVGASHARLCAKEVKHRLDELWEIVIVLPAPVLPCVGVVEVHWPTVSWKETDKRHRI